MRVPMLKYYGGTKRAASGDILITFVLLPSVVGERSAFGLRLTAVNNVIRRIGHREKRTVTSPMFTRNTKRREQHWRIAQELDAVTVNQQMHSLK